MIMIYTRFSADSRSSLTRNLAQPPPRLATCTFAIRTSRSLRYLATPKLVLTHTNYGKAGFTQSEFELHALSEVPGTPKMVLSHIKYGKAGCDREITPRLGVCDRDITTLSAHALIGHCLGNSDVTCQKYFFRGRWGWAPETNDVYALSAEDRALPSELPCAATQESTTRRKPRRSRGSVTNRER